MPHHLASPDWPAEQANGSGRTRRFSLPQFLLLSLLVHALALQTNFRFWPIFPVDRGIARFSATLRSGLPQPATRPARDALRSTASPPSATRRVIQGQTPSRQPAAPGNPMPAFLPPAEPPAIDAGDLVARSKADIDAQSRRKMLDPMFSAADHKASASPLQKATATRQQTIEHLDGKLIRITGPGGKRYCLHGLPEAATRDIPTPVLSIPMLCP